MYKYIHNQNYGKWRSSRSLKYGFILELFFAKIVNASKQESTKTLLSKRSSINKLNQFLNCLETKSTFSNTQKCFDKIKKRWEICNKV